jgi:hypothetical protein
MTQAKVQSYISAIESVLLQVEDIVAQERADDVLPVGVLALPGFSSSRTRLFYKLLLQALGPSPVRYLEVGVFLGATLISALHGNPHVSAIAIDNWSEFGGPAEEFIDNVSAWVPDANLRVIEQDAFKVDLPPASVDVFLYDGEHTHASQENAITHFWDALDGVAIVIVDDWNWPYVRSGTVSGLETMLGPGTSVWTKQVRSRVNGDVDGYWNGMGVFVINKCITPTRS